MPTVPRFAKILLGTFCCGTAVSDAQGEPDLTIAISATKPDSQRNYKIEIEIENITATPYTPPISPSGTPSPPPAARIITGKNDIPEDVMFTVTPSYGSNQYGQPSLITPSITCVWPQEPYPQMWREYPTASRCVIRGPLREGSKSRFTMELPWPNIQRTAVPVPHIRWSATIDDGDRVVERDETNNRAAADATP